MEDVEIIRIINEVRADVARERADRIAGEADIRKATAMDVRGLADELRDVMSRFNIFSLGVRADIAQLRGPDICSVCQANI